MGSFLKALKFVAQFKDQILAVWTFLNGKKVVIGATITLLSQVVPYLNTVLPAFSVDAAKTANVVGLVVTAVGLLHKLYKAVGGEQ